MPTNLGAMTGRGKALCRTLAVRHGIVTTRERATHSADALTGIVTGGFRCG